MFEYFIIIIWQFLLKTAHSNNATQLKIDNVKDGYAQKSIPFMVSIQAKTADPFVREHLCGGVIIAKQYVLTAAHCFIRNKRVSDISVVVGSNSLNVKDVAGKRYQAIIVRKHPSFEPLRGYDIAVVKIQKKFLFDGKNIDKINFSFTKQVGAKVNSWLIGWRNNAKVNPNKLELTSFETIDNKMCDEYGFIYITKTEVCAVSYFGRGACDGESGGPLVSTDFKLLYGLLSYGTDPCKQGSIYAFTRISLLKSWIAKQMVLLS